MSPFVWFLIGLFVGFALCACMSIWLRWIAAPDHIGPPIAVERNVVIYCIVVLAAVLTLAYVLSKLILEAD